MEDTLRHVTALGCLAARDCPIDPIADVYDQDSGTPASIQAMPMHAIVSMDVNGMIDTARGVGN